MLMKRPAFVADTVQAGRRMLRPPRSALAPAPEISRNLKALLKASLILIIIIGIPAQGSSATSSERSKPFQA